MIADCPSCTLVIMVVVYDQVPYSNATGSYKNPVALSRNNAQYVQSLDTLNRIVNCASKQVLCADVHGNFNNARTPITFRWV